ncbi:hypothetical protein RR46_10568 [Papilio xuthus]|uniref:Uncharacterized protein n=1 Tax=Papilio xuthus TaxID=66420 RepID=A0A194PJV8_PAPXU|nr:hypothetical protein RR46_10568 [Papilio xuthus]
MFEIDPKLFITCRLCLESTGAYQIVPSVQQQIKFCYEIEVDPFDALPQLICKDCESILSTYFKVKTNYVEKQKKLRERLQLKNNHSPGTTHSLAIQQEDDNVTSSQEISSEGNIENRKRIISFRRSLSEASDSNCSEKPKDKRKNTLESTKEPDVSELGYKKWFICRFCNHQCSSKSKIIRHINKHSSMKQKYINLIKRDCYVKLEKLDNKPNICKSKKYVVHSPDRITHSAHNFYYIIIKAKENTHNRSDGESTPELKDVPKSDDSDDNKIPMSCKNRRRKNRILSNDTIVIGNDDLDTSMLDDTQEAPATPNLTEISGNECIKIDDSDTDSFKSSEILTNSSTTSSSSVKNNECKTINNIISLCFKRHLKRLESNDTDDEPGLTTETHTAKLDSQIKHKVLSIGKKMINNSAFSCTGILRYLEHQNLEIVWTPKISNTSNKKSDCVRIMMKLKNRDENDGESGWKVLENPNIDGQPKGIDDNAIENEAIPKTVYTCNNKSDQNNIGSIQDDSTENEAETAVNIAREKDRLLKKLLNENPVPNPKKLTKKIHLASLSINKKKRTKSKENKSVPIEMPIIETDDMVMPVITSTVSLATVGDAEKKQRKRSGIPTVPISLIAEPISSSSTIQSKDRMNPEQEPVANFPRIKVKPASQLMSNPALNMAKQYISQTNMFTQSQNVNMAYQNNFNDVNMNMAPIPILDNATGYQTNTFTRALFGGNSVSNMPMSCEKNAREIVVMHSVDLPNTRTNSPFDYLKRLLQIHNIYLLSPTEVTPDIIRDFICLLKFKLVFQQESASPVALCLALFNLREKFFIKVKGINDLDIDICRLSPNWQWEILKVYSGEVVSKMLENAEKISPEVLMNTRNFVCYLKSIEFSKTA